MKSLTTHLLLLIATAGLLTSCGNNPEKARKDLAALGKQYTSPDFVMSAADGDITAVKLFVAAGMGVNTKANGNLTPLFGASQKGHVEIVRFLLEKGAQPDTSVNPRYVPGRIKCRLKGEFSDVLWFRSVIEIAAIEEKTPHHNRMSRAITAHLF